MDTRSYLNLVRIALIGDFAKFKRYSKKLNIPLTQKIDCDMSETLGFVIPDDTILFYTSNRDIIKHCLENGVNINAKNSLGRTALFVTYHNDNTDRAKALLDFGIDIDIRDNDGQTADEFLANRNPNICQLIVEKRNEMLKKEMLKELDNVILSKKIKRRKKI